MWRKFLVCVVMGVIGWAQIPNPDTYIVATIGDLETLDPAWHYDTASATAIFNIYETLIFYDGERVDKFVPMLATSWEVSEDGLTYTFTIRQGVKFQEGGDLTPEDVVYSFQRALIQDRSGGPIHMLIEPLLDVYSISGLAEKVGDEEAFRRVQEAVKLVDGKVVFKLAYPFAPFIQILAGSWSSILDKEWVIAQGGWDGTANWRPWHDPAAEESELFNKANGTGPFKLETWVPGEYISFVRNENYWREPAKLARAVIKVVPEWGTRLAMFEAGDADYIVVPRAYVAAMEPLVAAGKARMYKDLPGSIMQSGFFNFQVAEGSAFMPRLGGVFKPDLLSDIHLRQAFNHALDLDTYIKEAWLGEAWSAHGVIIKGRLGHNPDQPIYEFDMEKAEAELRLAWDGRLWKEGFRVTIAYNVGNLMRKFAAEMLERNIEALNKKRWEKERLWSPFEIEVIALPWPAYLKAMDAKQLAIFFIGWLEDYAHPHNWVHPYMYRTGAFAIGQNFHVITDVEFTPVYATFLKATLGPVSTKWVDKDGNVYHLIDWEDTDGNGRLGASDQITLKNVATGETAAYHVDAVELEDTDVVITVSPKEAGLAVLSLTFTARTYPTLQDLFDELVELANKEPDLEKAKLLYFELNRLSIDYAINIQNIQLLVRRYEQVWVRGWYYNPAFPGDYFYVLSKG